MKSNNEEVWIEYDGEEWRKPDKLSLALKHNDEQQVQQSLSQKNNINVDRAREIINWGFEQADDVAALFNLLPNSAFNRLIKQYPHQYVTKAVKSGQKDVVDYLLQNGAEHSLNIDENNPKIKASFDDLAPNSPLTAAAKSNQVNILIILLKAGANPNELGGRPLMYAAGNGSLSAVSTLLNWGADPSVNKRAIATPIMAKNTNLLEQMLEYDVYNWNNNGHYIVETVLVEAISRDQDEVINYLFQNYIPNTARREQYGALEKCLVKPDADINYVKRVVNRFDYTPFTFLRFRDASVQHGDMETVKYLHKKAINNNYSVPDNWVQKVQAMDKNIQDVLEIALDNGHYDIYDYLRNNEVPINNATELLGTLCSTRNYKSDLALPYIREFINNYDVEIKNNWLNDTMPRSDYKTKKPALTRLLLENGATPEDASHAQYLRENLQETEDLSKQANKPIASRIAATNL